MVYIPPVSLPNLQDHDYSRQLYGMLSGVGEAYYGAKRDKIGDQQWQQEQERLTAAQALAQSNADRNYAQELAEFEWNKQQDLAGGDDRFGTLIYETDPNDPTKVIAKQLRKSGPPVVLESDGNLVFPQTWVDTPQGKIPLPSRGLPNNVPPVESTAPGPIKAATEAATIQGGAAGNLPAMKKNAEYVKAQIDGVMNDPDLALVTGGGGAGGFGGILPADFSVWADVRDKGRNIQSKVDFVKAQVFPIAYDLIRGAGPIAIYESQAAAAAIARLERQNLSDEDYKDALADFKIKLDAMIAAVEAKAAGGFSPPAAPGQPIAPQVGGSVIEMPDGGAVRVLEE